MRCDVLAVGTELLLGQIVDTNSAWIGEMLAESGIDTFEHRKVGDNIGRIAAALTQMLEHADAVVVCGGLGPTQDDVTREAIAAVGGVALERRSELIADIEARFSSRGRVMPVSNLRQADVPEGAAVLPNPVGTAPGIRAEIAWPKRGPDRRVRVVYVVPGVPVEMRQMVTDHVLPDLLERSGEPSVIVSRSLKCWGISESGLSELIAERVDAQTNPSIAFLARGIEGLYVRLTAKAATTEEARRLIGDEEAVLRGILGDWIFGADDETIDSVVLDACRAHGWTLGVAESLTGGLVGGRLSSRAGASEVYRGSIASYATDVKESLLGVTAQHVVSEQCAIEMAEGARRVLGCDVSLAITGVAGPDEQDAQPVGTVWCAIAMPGRPTEAVSVLLGGGRPQIREFAVITLLDFARLRLAAR